MSEWDNPSRLVVTKYKAKVDGQLYISYNAELAIGGLYCIFIKGRQWDYAKDNGLLPSKAEIGCKTKN